MKCLIGLFLSNVWMCYLPERGVAMCLRRSHHPLLQGTTESVLTSCITVWYGNCSTADRKTLQRTVNTTAKIIGAPLPSILDIFLTRCSSKANSIMKDPTHPSHSLFQLLPSGRQYRSIRAPPPQTHHITEKKLSNFLVQFKCATHRWVGLYRLPVVKHSPLFTLDTFTHYCVYITPQMTR